MPLENIDLAVAAAIQQLSLAAASDEVRLQLRRVLAHPDVSLLARDGEEWLFRVPFSIREDLPEYRFFFMGRLLEVRRMGWMSDEYSLVDFPAELAPHRQRMQERFAAIIVTTDDGRLGWLEPGPWDEYPPHFQLSSSGNSDRARAGHLQCTARIRISATT